MIRQNRLNGSAVKKTLVLVLCAIASAVCLPAIPAHADNSAKTATGTATSTSQPGGASSKMSTVEPAKGSSKAASASKSPASAKTKPATAASGKSGHLPKIYDFGAAWCVPCHKFAPIFDKVKEQYVGKAEFLHVDFDDPKSKPLLDKYKVTEIPTLLMINAAGKVKYEKSGVLEEKELIEQVNKVVGR